MTGEQRAVVRTLLAVLAIVVGTIGVVHFWPDSGSSDGPVVVARSSTSSSTTVAVAAPSSSTSAPSTHTSGDPVERTVVDRPAQGLWVTTSGGACYYELLRDGVIVENTVASTLSVGPGVTSLQFEPSCTWKYDGFVSGD